MADKIRLLLVDDHALVREGLRALLNEEPDMEVAGEAENGQDAVELAARLHPDVVVMDIAMPGMNGLEATHQIRARVPAAKVLILTMHAEDRYLLPVIEAGGAGYVLKSATHQDLATAIRSVFRGDAFLYPSATRLLMKRYLQAVSAGGEEESYRSLSSREREVLKLVAEGYTSAEVGQQLFLSPKTVESYRERLASKLGIRSRAGLVQYALRMGLLRPQD